MRSSSVNGGGPSSAQSLTPQEDVPVSDYGANSYPAEYEVTSHERTLAILCHVLPVVLSFSCILMPLGPFIISLIEPNSPFVRKHSREAIAASLGYMGVSLVIFVVGFVTLCIFIGYLILMLIPVVGIIALLYAVLACIRCSEGKYFEYPLTGGLLK